MFPYVGGRYAKRDKKFQDLSENTEGVVEMFKFGSMSVCLSVCVPFSFTGSSIMVPSARHPIFYSE